MNFPKFSLSVGGISSSTFLAKLIECRISAGRRWSFGFEIWDLTIPDFGFEISKLTAPLCPARQKMLWPYLAVEVRWKIDEM